MTDLGVLNKLYSKSKTSLEFNFDQLWAPPIYNFLSMQDIAALYNIATSTRLSAKIKLKYDLINQIMTNRGFKKFAAGTNRVVYSYLEDDSFVVKIAVDKVGLKDNPAEFYNQALLQPFVTKCFSVSPCGTVGMFERVQPIINKQEFASIAEDIFDVITFKLIGKYVVDDIGSKYFMNWSCRRGFGPCLLDFPYVFELDSDKLYCNQFDQDTGTYCGGVIDYDDGFNNLICTKCGKLYFARDLEKAKKDNTIIYGGNDIMKVRLVREGKVIAGTERVTDCIVKPNKTAKNNEKKNGIKVSLNIETVKEEINHINGNATKNDISNLEIVKPEVGHEPTTKEKDEDFSFNVASRFIPKDENKDAPSEEESTKHKPARKHKRDSRGRFVKFDNQEADDYCYLDENKEEKRKWQQHRNEERKNKSLNKF